MTKFLQKTAVALATGSMIFANFTPLALADLDLEISGNGTGTDNNVQVSTTTTTVVTQSNVADINNDININTNTGGNSASKNTGGDVTVSTGDADTKVEVSNTANSNSATVDSCGGCLGDLNAKISGNGAYSDNDIKTDIESATFLTQTNYADVDNDVDIDSSTGYNDADKNTGGDVLVWTGDADVKTKLETTVNSNHAIVNGDSGDQGGLSLWITENGAGSDNQIALGLANATIVDQTNWANIANDVDIDADSGYNDADKNTGGDVLIHTGDADVEVAVDNVANFNWAAVADCCLLDGTAKVKGNGYDSDNALKLDVATETFALQHNELDCGGYKWFGDSFLPWFRGNDKCADVDVYSGTGDNSADKNTGYADSDPAIVTGDAGASVEVENSANSNGLTIGGGVVDEFEWDLPSSSNTFLGFLAWWMSSSN